MRYLKTAIDNMIIYPEECAPATAAVGTGPWTEGHKVELANALAEAANRVDPNSGCQSKKRARDRQSAPYLENLFMESLWQQLDDANLSDIAKISEMANTCIV